MFTSFSAGEVEHRCFASQEVQSGSVLVGSVQQIELRSRKDILGPFSCGLCSGALGRDTLQSNDHPMRPNFR